MPSGICPPFGVHAGAYRAKSSSAPDRGGWRRGLAPRGWCRPTAWRWQGRLVMRLPADKGWRGGERGQRSPIGNLTGCGDLVASDDSGSFDMFHVKLDPKLAWRISGSTLNGRELGCRAVFVPQTAESRRMSLRCSHVQRPRPLWCPQLGRGLGRVTMGRSLRANGNRLTATWPCAAI